MNVRTARAVGVAVVAVSAAAATVFGPQYPWLVTIQAVIAWSVGKLLGVPVDSVLGSALQVMEPKRRLSVTIKAVEAMSPEDTGRVIESMPPERRSQIIEFVDSIRPPPIPAEAKIPAEARKG